MRIRIAQVNISTRLLFISWEANPNFVLSTSLGEWSKTCRYCEGRVTMAPPGPCRYVWQHIQRHIYDNTRFNLVKSVNQYRRHLTVRRTTRGFNGTIATKRLFIMCPSTNIIGIKDKLILRANDSFCGLMIRVFINLFSDIIGSKI